MFLALLKTRSSNLSVLFRALVNLGYSFFVFARASNGHLEAGINGNWYIRIT